MVAGAALVLALSGCAPSLDRPNLFGPPPPTEYSIGALRALPQHFTCMGTLADERTKLTVEFLEGVCEGRPAEGVRRSQGLPAIPVRAVDHSEDRARLPQPVTDGMTAQGYPWVSWDDGVYVCTNGCKRWRERIVLVKLPVSDSKPQVAYVALRHRTATTTDMGKLRFVA